MEKLEKQKLKLKRLKAETSELESQLEAAQKDAEALPATQEACARAEKQAQQLQARGLAENRRKARDSILSLLLTNLQVNVRYLSDNRISGAALDVATV